MNVNSIANCIAVLNFILLLASFHLCDYTRPRLFLSTESTVPSHFTISFSFPQLSIIAGLRYDDLIVEENDITQEALRRLELSNPREAYDRVFRLRVAQQCSLSHALLPKEQWIKPENVSNLTSVWIYQLIVLTD